MSKNNPLYELKRYLMSCVIGQEHLIDRLLIALLADGHVLVEGAPGLAKTRAVRALAEGIDGAFQRLQFTPDLLPADITGTDIYIPEQASFQFQPGPLFHNFVLADEINRAPAKVQSALLEAMAERQVSVGNKTYPLPDIFMVMATQNPIEQEGTYPLPEAQLDRFLMHVKVDYPSVVSEKLILQLSRGEAIDKKMPVAGMLLLKDDLIDLRKKVMAVHMDTVVEEYIVQLIAASRNKEKKQSQLMQWLEYGASPRGTIALDRCSRAHALLANRDYVSPDDVQAVIHDVLRHRLILSFEAMSEGKTADDMIDLLLKIVPVA